MPMRVLLMLAVAALPAAAASPVVSLNKMAFGPAPAGLTVGQAIVFRNDDIFEHTATSEGDFDLDLKPGQSGTVVLKRAGAYDIVCRFHPTMTLHLTVEPDATPKSHGRQR